MKLIVNADDFGFSEEVNTNIINCHEKGIVSSTTILAKGEKFQEAVELSKLYPNLGVGVHLAIDGPFNIGKDYTTILNPKTGNFYDSSEIVNTIRTGKFQHEELVKEYSLQIEKVKNAGINITHLDHHHHLHLYFPILKAVIEVAKKYDIKHIRPQKILYPNNMSFHKKMYRLYHQFYLENKHSTINGYASLVDCDSKMMWAKFQHIVQSREKVVELVVHPLVENGEIDFLTNEEIMHASRNHLINYGEL